MTDVAEKAVPVDDSKKKVSFVPHERHEKQLPTSYLETLINLFKGNVGTGCFAMADAIKNGGIVLGPIITVVIAVICIECMHMLVRGAEYIMEVNELSARPDFAEVVELSCLVNKDGKNEKKWKDGSIAAKKICNVAICITQLGFCCVYLIFAARSLDSILNYYEVPLGVPICLTIILVPVWIATLVNKLKHIAIFSAIANVCMILGVIFTISYAVQDLPDINDREFARGSTLPLFFGTVIFAFEGIALVLPLQNAMKEPTKFAKLFGVLNVGMVIVSCMYVIIGFFGYWKYGEKAAGSLTLNLPVDEIFAQVIILMVALGVMLGYPIQFFVAIQIMLPSIEDSSNFSRKHPLITEFLFRSFMVIVTFAVAQLVPNLGLLLSLIGALFCTILVFIFPAIIELTTKKAQYGKIGIGTWIKNCIILAIAIVGMVMGSYTSIDEIVKDFSKQLS